MKSRSNYYLLSLGIAIVACITTENFYPNTWYAIYMIFVVLILSFLLERVFVPKIDKSISEKWGKYEESKSGITWFLARRMNWHAGTGAEDSRLFLEELGFVILGITDSMLYCVEPPLGWSKEIYTQSRIHILDENGKKRFLFFCKNEEHDYRAFLSKKI